MSTAALTDQVAHIGIVIAKVLGEMVAQNTDFNGQPLIAFGPADDSANAAPPSIYWLPLREEIGAGQRTGATGAPGPLYNRVVPVSFVLCGGVLLGTYSDEEAQFHDCDLTEILFSKLVNSIHRNVSQQSYAIEAVTWFNGGKTGIGMSCEAVIGFKLPLIREDNPTVTATAQVLHTEIAHD